MKEATARVKINKLLEAAGWRFFPEGKLPAKIQLELSVKIKTTDLPLAMTSKKPRTVLSIFCYSIPEGSPSSFLRPNQRIRIRLSPRSRLANIRVRRIAGS